MTISTTRAIRLALLGVVLSVGILAPAPLPILFGLAGGIGLPCLAGLAWLESETGISRPFSACLALILVGAYWVACGFLVSGADLPWSTPTALVVSVGANAIVLGTLLRQAAQLGHRPFRDGRRLPSVFPALGAAVQYVLLADFDPACADPSPDEWARAASDLVQDRLAGVALRLIRERGLLVAPEVGVTLREAAFTQSLATGLVMMHAAEAIELLTAAGIRAIVLKGPGIASEERSLQERPFGDLDLLVHPRDFRKSLTLLRAAGFSESRASVTPWDWCNRWCREAVNLKRPDGASVDLHHHVPPWLWTRRLSFDRVWDQSTWLSVGAVRLRVPSHAHRALLACLHVISDHGRPGETTRIWRDVILTLQAVDRQVFAHEMEDLRMAPWVSWLVGQLPAGAVAATLLPEDLDIRPAALPSRARLRYVLKGAANRSPTLTHAARLPLPNGVLYTLAMAFPSREFLRWRFDGNRLRWHWFSGQLRHGSWGWPDRSDTRAHSSGGRP
jgi:Uncharacterised nucleotidyltransferase